MLLISEDTIVRGEDEICDKNRISVIPPYSLWVTLRREIFWTEQDLVWIGVAVDFATKKNGAPDVKRRFAMGGFGFY